MKKLLVLVAATALLASCTHKEEVNNEEVNNGNEAVVEVSGENGEAVAEVEKAVEAVKTEANEEDVVKAVEAVAEEATETTVEEVVEAVESAK